MIAKFSAPLGTATDWAKRAGYPDNGKTGIRVRAWELEHDEKVRAAVFEVCSQILSTEGMIVATRELIRMASDPKDKGHAKAVTAILDRTGLLEKQEVAVRHKVELSGDALISRLTEVATRLGLDPQKLISGDIKAPALMSPLEYADAQIVEAEAVEEPPAAVPDWC